MSLSEYSVVSMNQNTLDSIENNIEKSVENTSIFSTLYKSKNKNLIIKIFCFLVLVTVNGAAVSLSIKNKGIAEIVTFSTPLISEQKPFEKIYLVNMSNFSSNIESVDVTLQAPFTGVIVGPTGAGKTNLVLKLVKLKNELCVPPPIEVHYCAGVWQDAFNNTPEIIFHEGIIDIEAKIPNDRKHRWIIVDDLMDEVKNSKQMLDLFTKFSHHKNISVWFLTQNFFHKNLRSLTLQAQYVFFGKNPREMSQMMTLGRQIFPSNPNFLVESYQDATINPYSFLFLDLKQNTPEHLRVLGNFLSENENDFLTAYLPK